MSRAAGGPRAGGRVRRAVVAAALAGLVAGAAAACGPEREVSGATTPSGSPSGAPSVSPSFVPSPSVTADRYAAPADAYVKPVRPAILDDKPSEKAAIALAEYYLRLYTYAYLTGDADELNGLARKDCTFCRNVKADLAEEYGGGGHGEGGAITFVDARSHDYGVDGGFSVSLSVRQAPNRQWDGSGVVVSDHPREESFALTFVLFWTEADGWRVGGVAVKSA